MVVYRKDFNKSESWHFEQTVLTQRCECTTSTRVHIYLSQGQPHSVYHNQPFLDNKQMKIVNDRQLFFKTILGKQKKNEGEK